MMRAVTKADRVTGRAISPQAIYEITKTAAYRAGISIAPHDLRRTFAKLAYEADGRIDQIKIVLGHASIRTTEIYLGTSQDIRHSPGDRIDVLTSPIERA